MGFFTICSYALIYLLIGIIGCVLIYIKQQSISVSLITKVAVVLLGTWFINYMCNKGYNAPSWFAVFFTIILMITVVAITMEINNIRKRDELLQPSDI